MWKLCRLSYNNKNTYFYYMSLVKQVTGMLWTIPSFPFRDNSIHLQECSPFWVGIFNKKNTVFTVWCRHAHSVLQSPEAFLYVIGKSNYMLTYRHLLLSLTFKGNTTVYYIQIVELLINKGANSYKLKNSKIGNRTLNPIAFTLLV